MSIQVENNLKNKQNNELFEQRAHYVPCKVDKDGPANVQRYFEPYVQNVDNGELTATFRGHPLNGTTIALPEGYQAVLVTEAKRPLAENTERKFQVAGGFKEIVYWNWDKNPSKNDNLVKALDWAEIAEAHAIGLLNCACCGLNSADWRVPINLVGCGFDSHFAALGYMVTELGLISLTRLWKEPQKQYSKCSNKTSYFKRLTRANDLEMFK